MIEHLLQDITHDSEGNLLQFKGSPLIKPPNVLVNLSDDHLKEYVKCKEDIIYFAENYVHIVDPDVGLSKIKLYDYQKRLLLHIVKNNHVLALTARQMGKCFTFWTKIDLQYKEKKYSTYIGIFYLKLKLLFLINKLKTILNNKISIF